MNNKLKYLFAMLCCFAFGEAVMAQGLSNRGKEFWVGYGHHQFMEVGQSNNQEMILYLSAEQAANVTVTIDGTTWVRNYSVPANTVIASDLIPKAGSIDARLISLPCSFVPPGTPCGGEGTFVNKGIHIVSDVPIVAYAHIYGNTNSGSSMLMPVETWGYSYTTLNSKQSYGSAGCFSWVYAIAQHDNTVLEITPTALTRTLKPANTTFTVTLNRGEIYQFMAGPEGTGLKPDLSGTTVKSIANSMGQCYPVAVFAGSSRTTNPISCGSGGGDNDNQQCFPTQAWGKRYLTAPTSSSTNASTFSTNSYKIAVKDPTTVVTLTRNGTQIPLGPLINGKYYFFESSTADYITADKPVMLGQFLTGGGCLNGGVGDPEMIYISPIEQGIKKVGFYRNDRENISVNYLTLIIPTAGLASLLIDGTNTFSHTYTHPSLAGYSVVVRRWTASRSQATARSDSAFTAITYGLGSFESYGYNAGTLINNLNAVGAIYNSSDSTGGITQHPFTCTNTPVELSVFLGYPTPPSKMVWKISQVGGGISPNTDVTVNAPVPVGTAIINGVPYQKFTLPGAYSFTTVGDYSVAIDVTHPTIENCTMTEEVFYPIQVKGKPIADFAINTTGCYLDTVQFVGQTTSSNGFGVNQWKYTFHDATISDSKDTAKVYAAPGSYSVNLRIISTEGCVSDTVKMVNLSAAPTTDFNISANACVGSAITFTDASTNPGAGTINNSYWDFGDGTVQTFTNTNPVTHTYAAFGTYSVKHVAGVGSTCVGDTVTKMVTIFAQPNALFGYPAGCLPASGTVQFTSNATAADGQAITGHLWNFGDPGSGAANTSTLANPSHTYPGFGNYTITYRSTTSNGCFKDTTVMATFNLAPTFNYPALAPVCGNAPALSIASATVTNGVPGSGIYSGPGTSTAGMFTPSIAGAGTHTIKYIFTTTANCTDSISQTIVVNPVPSAAYSIQGSGCLPASGQVNFTYDGIALPGQTYSWNFGDPASGANNISTLQNPSHNYTTGSFTITLTVTSADNCVKDSVRTQTFTVTPALSYPALSPVCESVVGTVNVATATVTNGVTGTGVYSGPGTDAAGNFSPSVAGVGTHTISYTFTTTSGTCLATITSTIVVYAKPTADFTAPTTACLPANGQAQFTYTGSMSAGQTYLWDFGDPASGANNTSTLQNPTHNYTNTGSYTVTVTVTNANGCTDTKSLTRTFSVTPALAYPALAAVCESVTGTISVATATVTNGVTGTGVYSGPGTDAAGNFSPSTAGAGTHVITYTFTSSGNCAATITSSITVTAKPTPDFTFPGTGCLPPTGVAQFTYTGTVTGGQTYLWNFGDPGSGANNTSTLQNPTHTYSTNGSFTISVQVTNASGCVETSTKTTTFNITPALAYPALAAVCESTPAPVNVATATVTNGVTGTGIYSGPGTDATGNFNPATAGAGTHTITYTFTSGTCSASVTSSITVNAKPAADFTAPTAACLPATGLAQFNYTGSMAAGQTYLWDFGDPASGASNSSTAQNPTHNYSNTGSYTVSVTVTNAAGCTDTKSITRTFSVTPALAYPPLSPACESVVGTVSVATATVTNGVSGTGIYSGPGTDAAGNFSASAAGPGTHTITYTFTSTGNCTATVTSTISIAPKPTANFTSVDSVCLGTAITFTNSSTIPTGSITSWEWNFDDGSGPVVLTTGAAQTRTYTTTGIKNVTLVVKSNDGCISDTARKAVYIGAVPVANFTLPAAVCLPNTTVSFTNTSTIPNAAALTYVWNFGDAASGAANTSTQASPTHTFSSAGSYNVTLTTTGPGGCSNTVSKVFDAFNTKPIAAFTSSASTVCQGTVINFIDGSSAAGSTIDTYLYLFGDGSTSSAASPTKSYASPGSYTVKLVVKSANGCSSDTVSRTVTVLLQPIVDAGKSFLVAPGTLIQFEPNVNNTSTASFLWSPPFGLSSATILRPTLTAIADQTYTLTASVGGLCTASDQLLVQVVKPVTIPNAFSPNGDGINDTWEIKNLTDYPGAKIEIFNRYGQLLFTQVGYGRPWDGRVKGKPLPVGTYYYIIQLNSGFKTFNGGVTILK